MRWRIPVPIIRLFIVACGFALIYAIMIDRLWVVQIKSGESHRNRISKQSVRKIRIPAIRGRIFTIDGKVLADNRPSYDVVFHLSEMRQPGRRSRTIKHILDSANRLAATIHRTPPLTKDDISRHMNYEPGLPITVFTDLNRRELALATDMMPPIDGMSIIPVPVRKYPYHKTAAHVIGATRQEDPSKAEDRSEFFYYIPDQTGRNGIERAYDNGIPEAQVQVRGLRGAPGIKVVRVNHLGYVHKVIGRVISAEDGYDLVLTLDYRAQSLAERLLHGKTGAVVLMNAETGAIIAMASSPSFDLNEFTPRLSSATWQRLQNDPDRPLFNRATDGQYTPGSILKPLIALSLLENGIDPEAEIVCDGASHIGNARVRCWSWRRGGHGPVNLRQALEQSCNDYFIENGRRLGLEAIAETLASAGIGRKTGIPIPEKGGLLPNRDVKYQRLGQRWTEYDTSILSMGQGIILVTPLQATLYAAAVANGGTIWTPYLLQEVRDPAGNRVFINTPKVAGHLKASEASIAQVQKGMWMVVNSPTGSARTARNNVIELSGKTGTAEIGPRSKRTKNTWFIAFGRHKGKLYAVTAFVEKGESGGRTSAPIARELLAQWLTERDKDEATGSASDTP